MEMIYLVRALWSDDEGQDVAEYALMLTVVLIIVLATVKLISANANNIFSKAANAMK
jgi:Flp pilus assembly pilin Flp